MFQYLMLSIIQIELTLHNEYLLNDTNKSFIHFIIILTMINTIVFIAIL